MYHDPYRVILKPPLEVVVMTLAIFFDVRTPLSKIPKTYENIDTEYLFGKGILPEHLNDDATGHALDKIAFQKLHSDTTTISFYGDYDTDEQEVSDFNLTDEEILEIVNSYNKDNRSGCNQVVVGKIVNEHGMPIANSVMGGNTSDTEWNTKALELVSDIFENKIENLVYIVDSKLMNTNLFRTMMDPKKPIKFISRCPANFSNKLEERVIKKA